MKSIFLSLFVLFAIVCFNSCKNEKKETTPAATETPAAPAATDVQATPAPSPPPQSTEPAQNAKGVWHYTCAKGCEGGSGTPGACAKCGGPLAHNATYHAQ